MTSVHRSGNSRAYFLLAEPVAEPGAELGAEEPGAEPGTSES